MLICKRLHALLNTFPTNWESCPDQIFDGALAARKARRLSQALGPLFAPWPKRIITSTASLSATAKLPSAARLSTGREPLQHTEPRQSPVTVRAHIQRVRDLSVGLGAEIRYNPLSPLKGL